MYIFNGSLSQAFWGSAGVFLVEIVESNRAAFLGWVSCARARVQHLVVGDAASRGDLQHACLLVGRVVCNVALCAHARRVRREDESVLPADDVSLVRRTGNRDVRDTRKERDPLESWRVVQARVESGREDGVADAVDAAQLQGARADCPWLCRGGEAGLELPTLEDGETVLRRDRGDVEVRRGREGLGRRLGSH